MKGSRIAGFSLIEILVVLVVISIILAVSYPSMSRASNALHLKATGRDVLNTFRYAREKAVTEQIRMKVLVDKEKQQLTLTNFFGDEARTYSLPKEVRIQRIAFAGNEIAGGSMVVRFLPNGSCDSSEVLLQADKGARIKVATDSITGGARIESDSGENAK
jgi:general secretion pathway protein H